MSFDLPPIGRFAAPPGPDGPRRPVSATPFTVMGSQTGSAAVPLAPPPEVWNEVEIAHARWEQLRAQGRELHFEADPDNGRITVEVRDLDGRLVRRMPLTEALQVAGGQELR
jgi:flagellar protein FlaG